MMREGLPLLRAMLLWTLASLAGCRASAPPGPVRTESPDVPPGLLRLEELAEDAYDQALTGDAAALEHVAKSLEAQWPEVRATVSSAGAPPAALNAMDDAIREFSTAVTARAEQLSLARATNAVSAPISELFRLYSPKVPPEVLALDYLGREEVLDARAADFSRAASQFEALERTWSALQGRLPAGDGHTAAARFAACLSGLREAISRRDARELEAQAHQALELVDELEKVFEP